MASKKPAFANQPVIGVIGLGIMGGMMAETLLKAGYTVCGHDPAPAARGRLKRAGGASMISSTAVAGQADVIIVSLATSAALAQVAAQISAAPQRSGARTIVVETSTLPLDDKLAAAARLKRAGHTVLDCPISGTAALMHQRTWTIYVSGAPKACERVDPILRTFTDNLPRVGPFGNGTRMKYAANHLVAIYNVACAEVVTLGRKMGLDVRQMFALFGPSEILGNGVMRLRMPFMLDRRYTPPTMKVEVWQKDMQVIGDMAKSLDCPLPLFNTCAPIYTAAMALGLAREDTASVAEVLGAMAGIPAKRRTRR